MIVFANQGDDGFTLLELLVAMTLLGLLSLVLFSGLRLGTQVWARSQHVTTRTNAVELLRQDVAQDLSHAYPAIEGADREGADKGDVAFFGTASALKALISDPDGSGALLVLTLEAADDDRQPQLRASARPELATSDTLHTRYALPHIRAVSFAYYGTPAAGGSPGWQNRWQHRKHLPRLIRMHLQTDDGRTWPDLVVRPHIDAEMGCVIDLLTHDCRGR